jgi:DUF4097 and DUF4098 domain-containing protein YvlB
VFVTLTKATADKAMSFSSLNGDIDVTLPADIKAKAKLKTDNGEITVISTSKSIPAPANPSLKKAARRQVSRPHRQKPYGLISGGGPEFLFQTFNGNIYIRKAK